MSITDYANYDGLGLAALVRRKQVSPRELAEAAIERIEKHNPKLNAVVHKAFDTALKVADGPLPEGPFKGVPFLIKDLGLRVKGMPRTDGTHFMANAPDADDDLLVQRYRAAGVVISVKRTRPNSVSPARRRARASNPAARPGTPITSPAAPRADRPLRSRRASCR